MYKEKRRQYYMSTGINQSIDTTISNYTVDELAVILNVNDLSDTKDIIAKSDMYIKRYKKENNKQMQIFFQEIQKELLDYAKSLNESAEQVQDWITHQALPQKNKVQKEKITERKQKIDVTKGGNHETMKREQLGVSNNYQVDVAQDVLNPNLKNTYTRLLNLDSQFRQTGGAIDVSTDYTLDLSDPLNDVLSMRLYSFQIPYTWYAIADAYNNRCFWVKDGESVVAVSIEPGNYTDFEFVTALTTSFTQAGFTFSPSTPVVYSNITGKITLNLNGGVYKDPLDSSRTFTITPVTTLIFFDAKAELQCPSPNFCLSQTNYINQTLGWTMGYRDALEQVNPVGNTGQAVLDLNGPRYLILAIDDYNQNHINNGLVGITEYSNHLKLPSYYSPDLPYICTPGQGLGTGQIEQLVPSAPRTLTNSQIYTINEIIKNNKNNTNLKAKAPTTTDVFAMIPIKQGTPFGKLYVDFSGSLQDNKRVYFGPVNVDRMRVRLLDDKGNVLNLNGSEWSFAIIVEVLYQY